MAGGNVTFYTLPIKSFGKDPQGEDINVVDVAQIQSTVKQLLAPAEGGSTSTSSTTGSTPAPTPSRTGTTTKPATPTVPTTVAGTGTPAPTDLTAISGGGIPCVK
jgi:hypothetical protein